ncbi:DUF3565 domain-containing protein [Spectribacter hydrogenooxidans]|uniref:DUF3565 domain-containing protein n=1 Tax=Spectribacter hydrogenoxidans TaxID=3075608 RepID=UPI0032C244DB
MVDYHRGEERHWVAELACGHNQHVRQNLPWAQRPWVTTAAVRAGRAERLPTVIYSTLRTVLTLRH